MRPALPVEDVTLFRDWLADRLGLHFDETKLGQLAEVLGDRFSYRRCKTFEEYRQALPSEAQVREELGHLAELLTVGETYFFRYAAHFDAVRERVLPERMRSRGCLQILSAGCASGEEPYTLAMLCREQFGESQLSRVSITAIDINRSLLESAARACYSGWSLRETPDSAKRRYFRDDDRTFALDDSIKQMVRFDQRNLMEEDAELWQPERYDLIFCRNVLIYFSAVTTRSVVDRLARSLAPGGFLFLGHSENLRGISSDFELRHTHDTFYYQRRDRVPAGDRIGAPTRAPVALTPLVPADTCWTEVIRRASDKIDTLSRTMPDRASRETRSSSLPATPRPSPPSPARDLRAATRLFGEERFAEALELLRSSQPTDLDAPEALLLRAAILTNQGQLEQAERLCRQILASDSLNAGAYYLYALCKEHSADEKAAVSADETAAYLDPEFAMPHLHLGLLAKRAGNLARAGREWREALTLLAREEPSRTLLFGGGFTKEALMQLCIGELHKLGEPT